MTYIGRTWLYWRNLTSIGRISVLPAEYDFHWQNVVYTGWLSLLLVEYIGRIRLPLAEYDLYSFIVTLTGRICSQSKVFCRSALLCRFNIPPVRPSVRSPQAAIVSQDWTDHHYFCQLSSPMTCGSVLVLGVRDRLCALVDWAVATWKLWNFWIVSI